MSVGPTRQRWPNQSSVILEFINIIVKMIRQVIPMSQNSVPFQLVLLKVFQIQWDGYWF